MMNSPSQIAASEALRSTSLSAITEASADTSTDSNIEGCSRVRTANIASSSPSLLLGVSSIDCDSPSLNSRHNNAYGGLPLRHLVLVLLCVVTFSIAGGFNAGCGDTPKPAETKSEPAPSAAEPAKPAVPDDVQAGAQALLGTETSVLLFGDLAKNGKQQFLAANVVPKTTKNNNIPGTIITRAVIAQNDDGQWKEIFRCDEHLKNAKGFLGGTPMSTCPDGASRTSRILRRVFRCISRRSKASMIRPTRFRSACAGIRRRSGISRSIARTNIFYWNSR